MTIHIRRLLKVLACLFLLGVLCLIVLYFLGPPPINSERNTVYFDTFGDKFAEDYADVNRHWVHLDEMSLDVIHATIAIEDQHFFNHFGFDLKRIFVAALKDIRAGSLKEGASTLTQQYARNLYLTHEKTWARKIKEAIYSVRLEMFYTKEEILEGYLNTIYYGHGAYGIEAASQVYFNKGADELTLAEAAMLAGVPKGPSYFSPFNDEKRAKQRQELILQVMYKEGFISHEAYLEATDETLHYVNTTKKPVPRSYFQEAVLGEAQSILKLSREDVQSGGYRIYTTFNPHLQEELESTVIKTVNPESDVEVGALAMDSHTGAIQALVGGRDFTSSSFNRATQSQRMTGSTFKPLLYYAALEHGFTASTTLLSEPTEFHIAANDVYKPQNFNGYYANDPITLAQAIALSDNVYAVKTHLFLGEDTLVKTARQFGITEDLPAVPSLALGTASVSLQEMVAAYGMLGNGGYEINSHVIEKITDRHGNVIYTQSSSKDLILDKKKAFILTELLTGMFDEQLDGYMPVTGTPILNQLTRPYAGKSGTTEFDSWMIGFSPELVTGVWIGYDDNQPLTRPTEKQYAKRIWAQFMEKAHATIPMSTFLPPKGVIGIPIDPVTGRRATPDCPTNRVMYFEIGTEPTSYCTRHRHQNEERDLMDEEKGIFKKWFDLFFD
ncbi:MAG TPA: PBP1A family penicillin-binding protein [Cerasibacillus sp.]|uniref:transglycosylase domain-containing protein n=1 Tax=Cerasibacillus sp. TaxID=2498711 RepID=UPI002F3E515A